jgi:futalosine hydrolase
MEYIRNEGRKDVSILVTGVGLTAATYALTRSVLSERPRFIIQAGIAGCLDETLPLTKVVLVENENIGDLGVKEKGKFHSLFDLNLLRPNDHPWKNGRLANNLSQLRQTGLTIVDGVTINEISTDRERISFYKNGLGASVESMEGASLHYVALMENIPFLQIRSLSNFAGERDKSKWVMRQAISSLNLEIQNILSKYLNK